MAGKRRRKEQNKTSKLNLIDTQLNTHINDTCHRRFLFSVCDFVCLFVCAKLQQCAFNSNTKQFFWLPVLFTHRYDSYHHHPILRHFYSNYREKETNMCYFGLWFNCLLLLLLCPLCDTIITNKTNQNKMKWNEMIKTGSINLVIILHDMK